MVRLVSDLNTVEGCKQEMAASRDGAPQRARSDNDSRGFRADSETIFRDHWQRMNEARHLIAASRQHARTIAAQIAAARQGIDSSKAVLARVESTPAAFVALPHAEAVALLPPAEHATGQRQFAAVADMAADIERAVADAKQPMDRLIADLKRVLDSKCDQHLVIGVLVEGIAQAIRQLGSRGEQLDVLVAALTMLRDRALAPARED